MLCPCYGPTYCLMGQLEQAVSDRALGAGHIQTGYRLAPCDPTACLVAGLLDAEQGRLDDGLPKLRRAIQLDPGLFAEVAGFLVSVVGRPDQAVDLAGRRHRTSDPDGRTSWPACLRASSSANRSDPVWSRRSSNGPSSLMPRPGSLQPWQGSTRGRKTPRPRLGTTAGPWCWTMARPDGGIRWPRLLADQGRQAEAIEEARICLRFKPDYGCSQAPHCQAQRATGTR